jgi:hypothetical protein
LIIFLKAGIYCIILAKLSKQGNFMFVLYTGCSANNSAS